MQSYKITIVALLLNISTGCHSQSNREQDSELINAKQKEVRVGGSCDGCELMYFGMPEIIDAADTSLGWFEKGQKIIIDGTVYKSDGNTHAPNVILYYYHTDQSGRYSIAPGMDERVRHGYLRGWVMSDKNGKFFIHTSKPASYPNEKIPAHIHVFVKEPEMVNEYYVDELVFENDKHLTEFIINGYEKRGGSGVLKNAMPGEIQTYKHIITLGLNIPEYK